MSHPDGPANEAGKRQSAPQAGGSAKSLARSAGIVSAAVLLSRITGLAREVAMARLFGDGPANDAFVLGFRIPNLTRDLFAEGALSSAFIPTFTRYLTQKSRREAAELAGLVAVCLFVFVGLVCVAGVIFAPQLVHLLAPGFARIPGKFELAVLLTRIMFPFLLLVALAAQAMGVLNAANQFALPALSSTFFNIGSLAAGIGAGFVLGPMLGFEPIVGMAMGVVTGGALQLGVQIPSLLRAGLFRIPRLDFSHPGLRQIGALFGPAILGAASVQINVMVNTNFASGLVDASGRVMNGPVSWLGYAFRLMQLPLGLFGVAIASATTPAVSRSAAAGDLAEFERTLLRSLGMVFLLTIPASAGLAVLGEPIIRVIYQHGAFGPTATRQTALALACYALGLPAYAALKVVVPAFYALGDSRTPMLTSLASIAINYAVAATMSGPAGFGHAGLALSTSAVALFQFTALLAALRHRLGRLELRQLSVSILRVLAAASAMSGVCFLVARVVEGAAGSGFRGGVVELALTIPSGLLVLAALCRLLRIHEFEEARKAFLAPVLRRLGLSRANLGSHK